MKEPPGVKLYDDLMREYDVTLAQIMRSLGQVEYVFPTATGFLPEEENEKRKI